MICYDSMGNSKEIYGNNGVFTFLADDAPIYLVGDIKKVERLDNTKFLNYNGSDFHISKNNIVNVEIQKFVPDNYTIDVVLPSCVEVVKNDGFENNKAVVSLKNTADFGEKSLVTIHVMDGDKIVSSIDVNIYSEISITTDLSVSLADKVDLNQWKATMSIKNMSQSKAVKGYLQFKSPESFAKLGKLDIGIIPRGRTGKFTFNLPEITKKGQYLLDYIIELDDGEVLEYTDSIDFTLAKYAEKKPKIDGVLEKGEWPMNIAMYADSPNQIKRMNDWGGINDLSGKSGIMWDEDNIYIFAEVTDDVFCQNEPGSSNWKGDSMQFGIVYGEEGFVAIGQRYSTFHEIGLSLSPEGPVAYRYLSQDSCYEPGYCKDAVVAVKRSGDKTIYEFMMPWRSLLRPGDHPKEGDVLGYSFLFNDNDGGERRGWIEYASGIGETKDSRLFTYLTLVK